ncbi:MAG: helix-turn-helix transcriptional regulator [Bacteroidetes bacterium]|nr:helix-turn-helix transcriptional regulator [Bacteroidota bacterium]
MEKLSIPSAESTTFTYVDGHETSISEVTFAPKKLYFTIISEMSLFLYNYHQKRQERYKQVIDRFQKKTNQNSSESEQTKTKYIGISKEILEAVLLKLHAFETQKSYLDQDLSLSNLAKQLGTNSSYLSKIINQSKGKSFKNYLNDLRIVHAHAQLKDNPQKRKFTIEAIAFDNGFRSAESFSKKFKERYEMYPSVYLKSLSA